MKKLLMLVILLLIPSNIGAVTYAPVDITDLNIIELQDAVDKGYLTYELITKLYLERIKAYDDEYNAIINLNENALKEAREKDNYYKEHGRTSLLFGIPIIVKDNIDVKEMPTTLGTKSLKDNYPKEDAQIIKNLKDKGAIILAKSNMSEFAFMASSSTSSYGTTKNAYNSSYSSYGSSGGSAVSVSLKYAPIALGTDTNSSLRSPSSAASVIGFRPSLTKLSTTGIINYDMTRDTSGVITTNIYDNAIIMAALENKEDNFYLESLERSTLSNITIGVIDDFLYGNDSLIYGTGKTYDKLVTLFEKTLKKLEENGVKIVHIKNFYTDEYAYVDSLTSGGWTMCYSFNKYIRNSTSKIRSFEQLTRDYNHIYSLYDYLDDCTRDIKEIDTYEDIKKDYRTYVENIYKKYNLDVLVYPTTKNRLSRVGESNFESASYAVAPVLGLPAVSMPLGFIDNLPYGIEFVVLKNNEQRLYEILYNYEKINNVYQLPSSAKNLYEIPESVEKLKKIYEENKEMSVTHIVSSNKVRKYKENLLAIKEFFSNYANYKDISQIEKKAKELYQNYEKSLNDIENIDIIFILRIIGLIILGFIILFIIVIKIIKKCRRIKRRRYKNMRQFVNISK